MRSVDFIFEHEHAWVAYLAMFVILLVALVAVRRAWLATLRRMSSIGVIARTLIAYTAKPGQALLVLLVLHFATTTIYDRIPFSTTLRTGMSLLTVTCVTWLAVRAVSGFGEALHLLHPLDIENNLEARRIYTQTRVLSRVTIFFVLLLGVASALMLFPDVRQLGASLLASAGIAGVVAGIAARPVLGNLIAGLQIALTQPIRLDDVVVIENEWGRIEEITSTYVVVRIWDDRRLVVPLQWVIEHPFQNWTRQSAQLLGTVFLWVDYTVPLAALRAELDRACKASKNWDHRVALIQVVETSERAMQLRALVSAADGPRAWDLRCEVREALLDLLQREYPESLPLLRMAASGKEASSTPFVPAMSVTAAGGADAGTAAGEEDAAGTTELASPSAAPAMQALQPGKTPAA